MIEGDCGGARRDQCLGHGQLIGDLPEFVGVRIAEILEAAPQAGGVADRQAVEALPQVGGGRFGHSGKDRRTPE